MRSPNFSPSAKEKTLRILNDLFRVKVRMKLAAGIAQTPPPDPPDLPDLPRVLVTSNTIMS
ncbi:unnamed protein product [Arabis nemorensis]|uniref:Uncharacterized protein n=1 Tax=Arabis nemorensis TaxID=586526 RepID=A0A565CQS9_9BRAS|nr:unnamed protein product [Arabis nemorensis]